MAPSGGEDDQPQPRVQARSDQFGHGARGDRGGTVAGLALCAERWSNLCASKRLASAPRARARLRIDTRGPTK